MILKLINNIKNRFINSTKSQSISYITLIFALFIGLVLLLTQINAQITSLNYKVKYMLENRLNTKVSFSKIDGDFTKELIIHDAIIYHEFRNDIPLVKAKKVIVEFNIAKALLKDSIPVNNISRVGVYDYVVYIDEFFTKTKALRFLIPEDDGIKNNPYMIVDIYNGEVKSAFLNKELGKFHARKLDVLFKITPTTFSFNGEGYVEGDKPYGNTKTNFRIKATNNINSEIMYGLIDLENVSYLDQNFKAIALECAFSNREVQFRTRPSKYLPYLKKLPKHQITSYKQNKYDHLIDISVRYLLNDSEIYINVPFDNKNIASKIYAHNFLKEHNLLDFMLKQEKWMLNGYAKLKFNGTILSSVDITLKKAKNIFLKGDILSVVIKSIRSANNRPTEILFKGLDYKDTKGGSIEGNLGFYTNKMPKSGELKIKKIALNPIYKIINKNKAKIETKVLEAPKTIFNTNSTLTTNIIYHKINKNIYNFKISRSYLRLTPLPELEGEVEHNRKGQLNINLRCNDYINLKALASLNINNLNGVKFNILINELDYDYLLLLVKAKRSFIKPNDKLTLKGQLKGIFYPNKIKESQIIGKTILKLKKGGRLIRPINSTSSQNHFILPSTHNYLEEEAAIKGAIVEDIAKDIAEFDFKYKNNNLYFSKSYINPLDIYFKGLIKLDLKNLYTELTLNYKGFTMYLDGYFKKLKESYYTKLNLIYDNFKKEISSLEAKIKLDDQKIILKDGKIRYKRKNYSLSGNIAFEENKISPDLKLENSKKNQEKANPKQETLKQETLNEEKVNIAIKGNITLKSQGPSLKTIIPKLNIRYNDTKYLLGGKVLNVVSKSSSQSGLENKNLAASLEEQIFYPSLEIEIINIKNAKRKSLILKGKLSNKGKRFKSNLDIRYNGGNYTFELDLDYTLSNTYQVRLQILSPKKSYQTSNNENIIKNPIKTHDGNELIEQSNLFAFAGNISFLPTLDNEVLAKGEVTVNDYSLDIDASLSYKGRIVNTNIEFKTMEGVHGRISGYITYNDKNYFPYLRVNIYKDIGKIDDKSLSFLIEGKITQEQQKYKIDTVLNKRLIIKGEFKKYFPLNLNISFNNFPIEISKKNKVILHTKYDDPKGITVRIDQNGVSVDGNILLQQLTILDSKAPFKIDTSFSYNRSFKRLRESKDINIALQAILDRQNDREKQPLKMRGLLRYKENTINLSLKELKKRFNLDIKYGPYEKTLDIMLNKLNINGLVAGLDGIFTGHIKTKFLESEDSLKILARRLMISNGKYNGIPFSGEFTFYKDKVNTKVKSAKLNIKDVNLRVKDLIYKSATNTFDSDILNLYLSPKSKVKVGSLILSYKDLKFILTDFKYQTGVVGVQLLSLDKEDKEDKESNIWDLVRGKGSAIDFKKGFVSYRRANVLLIERFHYNPGKIWNIDFDAKLKSTLIGNNYTGEFNVYGGKHKIGLGNELTITAKKLSENKEYYKDFKLIARSKDNKNWAVKINREDIKLTNLSYDGKRLIYDFEYTNPQAGLVSVGEIDFTKGVLNVGIVLYHLDLRKSILAKSFLEEPKGLLNSKMHLSGDIFDPKIDGELSFQDGNLNLKGESKDGYMRVEDAKLYIEFNKAKVLNKGDKSYNHEIKVSGAYLDGHLLIDGYFNTADWLISDFDINVKTKEYIKLDFASSLLNYEGRLGLDTNISGRLTAEKSVSGILYAKDAEIAYIGAQTNQTYNLLEKLRFNVLKIYIEDDVSVNIGKGNLSVGEVSLKKYNKKKHTGSYLVLKKDINDVQPRLRGNFEANKGSFDYLGNTFSIVDGILDLGVDGKNRLRMKAKTRKIRDEQNRSVTVYMVIDDELSNLFKAADKGRTTFEDSLYSTPSKSKEEISLLLYGNIREDTQNKLSEINTYGQEANAGKAADILLNLTLVKPIERKLKQIFGIDSFNIKQTILQNTLFYRARSGSGYIYLGEAGYEVHFLSNTEITVGKYLSFISDSLFLSGGLRLEQDTYKGREGLLKNIWKISLDADIFPLVGYETEIMQLNIGVEYQYRQNELTEGQRHEGLIKCELQVEF